tara:strand:+ start:6564 stop:8312 length:1749 start_codon:yes stop_codon:yes gene_type:complete
MPYGQFYPGTTNRVTHSYEEAEYNAEFDDALIDQAAWKNSRYDGSKTTAKEINKFTPSSSNYIGDESWGNLPTLSSQTTALYIANTVVGYKENANYADIKNHSYVGINKILLVNYTAETVQIIDKAVEPFEEFHRFITNDLPTGKKVTVKIIDDSTPTNLKGNHRVKMNKGWLLKSFDFNFGGEKSGSLGVLSENNSMYLYSSGSIQDNTYLTGSAVLPAPENVPLSSAFKFKFALNEMFPAVTSSGEFGHKFGMDRIGPSFASSSIIENKFTQQYYSGSYGLIKHAPLTTISNANLLLTSGLSSASRFLAIDSLNFLSNNITNTNLTEQEKTEIHITFFEGTKDFTKGVSSSVSSFDERSIGTFEIDQNRAQLDITAGDGCNGGLPTNFELIFKGQNDNRFLPKLHTFEDAVQQAHLQSTSSVAISASLGVGCAPLTSSFEGSQIQSGITIDRYEDMEVVVQGGAAGQTGYQGAKTSSLGVMNIGNVAVPQVSNIPFMTTDNFYSGSFNYQYSFLDKDHTLIMDIDKDYELDSGIGDNGLVIIPDHCHPQVSFNLEFYLEKAGIIGNNTNQPQQNIGTDIF